MQHEQFTNPHYQKILEKVIKHRHPELSFEKGLTMECNDKIHCIVFMEYEGITDILSYEKASKIITCDLLQQAISNKTLKYQILGRPITICELCDVLNTLCSGNKIVKYYNSHLVLEYLEYESGTELDIKRPIALLQPKTYYLHEQPIEVQEKIANLF